MPNSYVLKIGMFIPDFFDRVLQSIREAFLVRFKAGPTTLKLGLPIVVLRSVKWVHLILFAILTRDCQLSSMIKFVTTHMSRANMKKRLQTYFLFCFFGERSMHYRFCLHSNLVQERSTCNKSNHRTSSPSTQP